MKMPNFLVSPLAFFNPAPGENTRVVSENQARLADRNRLDAIRKRRDNLIIHRNTHFSNPKCPGYLALNNTIEALEDDIALLECRYPEYKTR